MIEVEKKFQLSGEQQERLLEGATFLKEKIQTDTYFDTLDYKYSRNHTWLRERDGSYELKISIPDAKIRLSKCAEKSLTIRKFCLLLVMIHLLSLKKY